jgi:hypothetical protein
MGDPTLADRETGRRIYEAALGGIVAFLDGFRELPPEGERVGPDGAGPEPGNSG